MAHVLDKHGIVLMKYSLKKAHYEIYFHWEKQTLQHFAHDLTQRCYVQAGIVHN